MSSLRRGYAGRNGVGRIERNLRVPRTKRATVQAAALGATEDLLEGATYADLNIERIATRACISRTAFYFYFRHKHELLMRLTEDLNEQLFQQAADIWFSGDGEPEAELRSALTNIAAVYAEHAPLVGATVEVSTYDEEVARFFRAPRALHHRQQPSHRRRGQGVR